MRVDPREPPFPRHEHRPRRTILHANTIAARNLSTTPEEVRGKSLFDFFPERAAATRERIKQTVTRREVQHFESQVTLPDGRERFFDSQYCPAFGPDGEVVAVQIVARDVTDLRQAEEVRGDVARVFGVVADELSMTTERVRAILHYAPVLITVFDPTRRSAT